MRPGRSLVVLVLSFLGAAAGCSGWLARSEGVDPKSLPDAVRPDYDLFALRCSKCHSLARPLSSGIDDDDYWAMYVARMRRQPGSGISYEDTVGILRFLHYYSLEQRRKKERRDETPPPVALPTASSNPAPPPPAAPAPAPSASGAAASPGASLRARGGVL